MPTSLVPCWRKQAHLSLYLVQGGSGALPGAHKMEQGVSDKTRHRELLLNRPGRLKRTPVCKAADGETDRREFSRPLVQRMAQSGFKPEKTVAMLQQVRSPEALSRPQKL